MKQITFPHAGILSGVASMLECLGVDTEDHTIALAMEAPYLFIHEEGQYSTGCALYRPKWLNPYLHTLGFHMSERHISSDAVPSLLRSLTTAMLPVKITRKPAHPIVFTGYSNGRYNFSNIKHSSSSEPDHFSFSTAMLKRRLDAEVSLFILEPCKPERFDYIPLLFSSLSTLEHYRSELLHVRSLEISRAELETLDKPLFRAFMRNLRPMAALIEDWPLVEELSLLEHDYRHVFTHNSPDIQPLWEYLPHRSIENCLAWQRENIIDRLYELGADEELLESIAYPQCKTE